MLVNATISYFLYKGRGRFLTLHLPPLSCKKWRKEEHKGVAIIPTHMPYNRTTYETGTYQNIYLNIDLAQCLFVVYIRLGSPMVWRACFLLLV